MSSTFSADRGPFRFLQLPAEIRNAILEAFLIPPHHFKLTTCPPSSLGRHAVDIAANCNDIHPSALFQSCRQIHHGACSIFYPQNHFDILITSEERSKVATAHHFDQIATWLESLGSHKVMLKHVSIMVFRCIEWFDDSASFMPDEPSLPLLNLCNIFWSSSQSFPLALQIDVSELPPIGSGWNVDISCINKMLQNLILDNGLGEKNPYASLRRVGIKHLRSSILGIRVYASGSQGCILWKGSASQESYLPQKFRTWFQPVQDGHKLSLTPHEQIPSSLTPINASPAVTLATYAQQHCHQLLRTTYGNGS